MQDTHPVTADSQSSMLGGFLSGPALCWHHFWAAAIWHFQGGDIPGRVPSEKRGHPFSLSWEGSVRVRRSHQGQDCALPPHCFLSHDLEEGGSPDLPHSIADARALVMGPSVGRCKWNTESNNNPPVPVAS